MSEDEAPIDVPLIPAERRFWLLSEALRSLPLNEALELARRAERFITGGEEECDGLPSRPLDGGSQQPGTESGYLLRTRLERTPVQAGARLALSAAQRDKLLDRLSQGARNGELASEFGLSSKQVQGIRMGSAREIAKRRDGCNGIITSGIQETAWTEDVVRYLRQRDDTVVPEGSDSFLVNGRFRLATNELVERANKMRRRQGKPEFRLRAQHSSQQHASSSNDDRVS